MERKLPSYCVRVCPVCGKDTMVRNTRERENGVIYRRRGCSECNYRFSTIEIDSELFKAFLDMARNLKPNLEAIRDSIDSLSYAIENSVDIDDAIQADKLYGLKRETREKHDIL